MPQFNRKKLKLCDYIFILDLESSVFMLTFLKPSWRQSLSGVNGLWEI